MIFIEYKGSQKADLPLMPGKIYAAIPEMETVDTICTDTVIVQIGNHAYQLISDGSFVILENVYVATTKVIRDFGLNRESLPPGTIMRASGLSQDGMLVKTINSNWLVETSILRSEVVILDSTNIYPGISLMFEDRYWYRVTMVSKGEKEWIVNGERMDERGPISKRGPLDKYRALIVDGDIATEPIVRCKCAKGLNNGIQEGAWYRLVSGGQGVQFGNIEILDANGKRILVGRDRFDL